MRPQIQAPTSNGILSALPEETFVQLTALCEPISLHQNMYLYESMQPTGYIYFIESGLASVVVGTAEGLYVECGMTGREGMTGLSGLFGGAHSLNDCIVQIPGSALRARATAVKRLFLASEALRIEVLKYAHKFLQQVCQTALCNRAHHTEKRLSRWLLMCSDRAGADTLMITHELLSSVLGATRVSVTIAASELQERGLIHYSRGKVAITDRAGLEAFTCECYANVKREYGKL